MGGGFHRFDGCIWGGGVTCFWCWRFACMFTYTVSAIVLGEAGGPSTGVQVEGNYDAGCGQT